MGSSVEIIRLLVTNFLPFLFALSFHEFAHAWMARKKGDETAYLNGRYTLNPLVHADLMGTFVLPIVGMLSGWPVFGWAKPVPVNTRFLNDPKKDMFWIALAGPLSNLLLALIGTFIYSFIIRVPELSSMSIYREFLQSFVLINVLLAIFNLLPFHPLDGGKVLARFLPTKANYFLEQHQQQISFFLMFFFILGGFRYLSQPVIKVMGVLGYLSESVFHLF